MSTARVRRGEWTELAVDIGRCKTRWQGWAGERQMTTFWNEAHEPAFCDPEEER